MPKCETASYHIISNRESSQNASRGRHDCLYKNFMAIHPTVERLTEGTPSIEPVAAGTA